MFFDVSDAEIALNDFQGCEVWASDFAPFIVGEEFPLVLTDGQNVRHVVAIVTPFPGRWIEGNPGYRETNHRLSVVRDNQVDCLPI